MGIDVIVCSYRTPSDLRDFLESLRKFPPTSLNTDLRVIVTLVSPQPDDYILSEFPDLPIHPVVFNENVGYAKAVNHAASLGDGAIIAAFNADVELSEGALDECYEALMCHDRWGALGPRQVDQEGRITHAGIFGPDDHPQHRGWHVLDNGVDFADVREDAYSVSGSAYFVKRSAWEEMMRCPIYRKIDPQSEGAMLTTPLYYEETWLSVHLRSHGYLVTAYGPVCITHKWHRAIAKYGGEYLMPMSREMFRNACEAHGILHD